MNPDDIVCELPPRIDQLQTINFLTGLLLTNRWEQFTQPAGGFIIEDDGELTSARDPRILTDSPSTAFLNWGRGRPSPLNRAHSSVYYQRQLESTLKRVDPPTVKRPVFADFEAMVSTGDIVETTPYREGDSFLPSKEDETMATIAAVLRPRVHHVAGSTATLFWMDVPIAEASTRGELTPLKSSLIRMVKTMTPGVGIDGSALVNALTNFLETASHPGGGMTPPIDLT